MQKQESCRGDVPRGTLPPVKAACATLALPRGECDGAVALGVPSWHPVPLQRYPVAILWGRGSMAEAPWPTTGGSNVRYSRSPPRRRLRRRLLRCLQLVPNIVSRSSIQSTAEALLTRCSLPRVAVPRRPCRVGRAASCGVVPRRPWRVVPRQPCRSWKSIMNWPSARCRVSW